MSQENRAPVVIAASTTSIGHCPQKSPLRPDAQSCSGHGRYQKDHDFSLLPIVSGTATDLTGTVVKDQKRTDKAWHDVSWDTVDTQQDLCFCLHLDFGGWW